MGNRRLFSRNITDSTRFLKLPLTAQALYFHLCLHADDDGIVEAFGVMRMIGSNEDDFHVLSARKLITVLNQDYVAFIDDWREHNTIRPDRKVDSIYQELLISVLPDVQLQPSKKGKGSQATVKCLPNDSQMTDDSQPNGSLSKDKLSKDKLSKDKLSEDKIDYQQIVDMYNETCVSFPRLVKLSEARKKAIRARLKNYTIEDFRKLFQMAEESRFLKGGNDRSWSATFDWLIKDSNMAKVLDGNYSDQKPAKQPQNSKENAFHNFEQREGVDYDDLEEKLLGKTRKEGTL